MFVTCEASVLIILFRLIFPPAESELIKSSEQAQVKPLEDTADSDMLKEEVSASSVTGVLQLDEWVTVEQPSTESDELSTVQEAKLKGPNSDNELEATSESSHATAKVDNGEQHVQNSLLKDW